LYETAAIQVHRPYLHRRMSEKEEEKKKTEERENAEDEI
jgi:hypothetical protein